MQKQPEGHLVGDMPIRQDDPTNEYAPEVAASEAWDKFLNQSIRGKLEMQSSTLNHPIQVLQDGVEVLDIFVDQLDDLRALMSAIARLSTDDNDIRGLAIHAKVLASGLHNDADVLREQIQNHLLAA
ncbi:hypothetical protein PWG14_20870 (plasmid) [Chromobacterium amazonense]|uniref:hypothetical protein n=1 Tax=Chromobacterium amazonense TaxID=1382803 RepID=UPI00237D98C2|nr:hypothetical protein [Chromobacterium amazonense]MDE1714945.1 hypothetical protein [Chromobacterium amazonense]